MELQKWIEAIDPDKKLVRTDWTQFEMQASKEGLSEEEQKDDVFLQVYENLICLEFQHK
jgi:hypothetical protein